MKPDFVMRCCRRIALLPTVLVAVLLPAWGERLWGQGGPVRVTGSVTSGVDSSALPAVRVTVKGTNIAVLTATNGRYALDAPTGADTLVFNMIGFRATQVPIADRSVVNVVLEAAAVPMQEVVVTGYGTQQRRDVTGAVADVKAQDLTPIPVPRMRTTALSPGLPDDGVTCTPATRPCSIWSTEGVASGVRSSGFRSATAPVTSRRRCVP